MRDEDHPVVGHPEQARLLERLVDERLGRHGRRGNAASLELNHVAHTARRARASIGEALDREVAAVGYSAHDLGTGRLGEDLLHDPEGHGSARLQQFLHTIQEFIAAALGDVKQRDPRSVQIRRPGSERLGQPAALVEWAHVVH
jgi:hypothetical protein